LSNSFLNSYKLSDGIFPASGNMRATSRNFMQSMRWDGDQSGVIMTNHSLLREGVPPLSGGWHAPSSKELNKGVPMLGYAITFLIIALIAGVLGFAGLAGLAASIAHVLFVVFLVLFIIALITGRRV
jgi:uncharacterized membrane protein YtjA (UPF0391 family)